MSQAGKKSVSPLSAETTKPESKPLPPQRQARSLRVQALKKAESTKTEKVDKRTRPTASKQPKVTNPEKPCAQSLPPPSPLHDTPRTDRMELASPLDREARAASPASVETFGSSEGSFLAAQAAIEFDRQSSENSIMYVELRESAERLDRALEKIKMEAALEREREAALEREASPPPRPIISEDEFSEASVASLGAGTPKRRSMFVSSVRGVGAEMDMATRRANEALLKGKEAIEEAGNMKRECKSTALECMQILYEAVLGLSDSRSRHKFNLEKERSRNANELMRIERAHSRQIAELTQKLTEEMAENRKAVQSTLGEAKAIRSWLGYETQAPYAKIEEIACGVKDLDKSIRSLSSATNTPDMTKTQEVLRRDHEGLQAGVAGLQKQLDEIRRSLQRNQDRQKNTEEVVVKSLALLEAEPKQRPNEKGEEEKEVELKLAKIETMLTSISTKPEKSTPPPVINITNELQPLTERLEAVSSELRTMREDRLRAIPPMAASLASEIADADGRHQQPAQTYANITAKPPPRKPNHTLIVTATDPEASGENVIAKIREALDTRKTGAKVDRVRKARNQKVVLSCGTQEDLNLVRSRVEAGQGLKVEVAKAGNPLAIIRDVLSDHTDAEITENLLAQNKHILQDVNLQEQTIRVRYRKRARNQHECHPVLELSPLLHKRFIEAEKVYIGLQRRPIFDQSPLVQCIKCLGFGHTKAICREGDASCSHCGGLHSWEACSKRKDGLPPTCKNCSAAKLSGPDLAHNAFRSECRERQKWDAIARSRVNYC